MMVNQKDNKQWWYIGIAMVIGIFIMGYKTYTYFIPVTAEFIAEKIPDVVYEEIGEASLNSFDQETFSPTELNESEQDKVQQAYDELITTLALPPEKFKLFFRNFDGKVNAFALMDGSIIVSDALVRGLNDHALIQAVLLHEMGHIEHNHLMENTIRVSLFYIILSMVFGDISVVSDLLIEGSTHGLQISYSRDMETEADLYAVDKLNILFGDASAMEKALIIIHEQNEEQDDNWLSTHPTLVERIKNTH